MGSRGRHEPIAGALVKCSFQQCNIWWARGRGASWHPYSTTIHPLPTAAQSVLTLPNYHSQNEPLDRVLREWERSIGGGGVDVCASFTTSLITSSCVTVTDVVDRVCWQPRRHDTLWCLQFRLPHGGLKMSNVDLSLNKLPNKGSKLWTGCFPGYQLPIWVRSKRRVERLFYIKLKLSAVKLNQIIL